MGTARKAYLSCAIHGVPFPIPGHCSYCWGDRFGIDPDLSIYHALPDTSTPPIAADSTALKRISHTVGEITITVETTGSVALLAELLALAMKEVP